ncbi:protein of unknown function [Ralstonia solanacearum CMR15]|nr:protein of unknown function [Ralstonia solanacearum CMR15]
MRLSGADLPVDAEAVHRIAIKAFVAAINMVANGVPEFEGRLRPLSHAGAITVRDRRVP